MIRRLEAGNNEMSGAQTKKKQEAELGQVAKLVAVGRGEQQQKQAARMSGTPQPAAFHSLSPSGESEDQLIISSSASSSGSSSGSASRASSLGATDAAECLVRAQKQQHQLLDINACQRGLQVSSPSKSPILIKYNYYDYNGARQEQENHDMNYNALDKRVQRNLSPTFKQSLDQIVRNSQQLQQLTSGAPKQAINSPVSSPEHQQQVLHFARRYKLSSYEQRCLRCNKTVYQMDKVGPLKDFTFYHQNCFKCRECGTKLTLKTYFNNQQSSQDHEVYCHRHCPKTGPGKLDNQSVGIRAALNAPKVFEVPTALQVAWAQQAASCQEQAAHLTDSTETAAGRKHVAYFHHQLQLQVQQQQHNNNNNNNNNNNINLHHEQPLPAAPQVDSSALYIQHAVQQTRLQNIYKQSQVDKKISQFINRRLEFLEPKQKLLEMRHREEEDQLFKTFEQKWRQEESSISEQIRLEWERELSKLLDKYKRQLSNISTTSQQQQQAKLNDDRKMKNLLLKQLSEGNELSKQQMIEFERMNLEKTMTIKLDRKKETLKRKLKEFERQATAELVEKQSREMLSLISMKLDEYKEEQKRIIGSDLEQFEAIESLANQLGSSLQFSALKTTAVNGVVGACQPSGAVVASRGQRSSPAGQETHRTAAAAKGAQPVKLETPAPKAPQVSKMELYNNEEPDEVFREIDQLAINVAKEDQQSFTDLVHHLTRHCLTDIEKVRAIFRWITVKNLNTMQFDSSVKPDTPLGLLRGIKNGSESYHVLFKRLCSYAGLHCVVIKGYSKSAGYQPGVKFEGNRFRNSWNAVYVAGAWRFVQCNWGARHLVSVAVMQDKNQPVKKLADAEPQPTRAMQVAPPQVPPPVNTGRSAQQLHCAGAAPVNGRRALGGALSLPNGGANYQQVAQLEKHAVNAGQLLQRAPYAIAAHSPRHQQALNASHALASPTFSSSSNSTSSLSVSSNSSNSSAGHKCASASPSSGPAGGQPEQVNKNCHRAKGSPTATNDSLRYEYDDHYFLTDPDEFIYEFYPLNSDWQLLKTRPITLSEFEQLPFVRSLFFKYGLYFPQTDIRSVLHTDSSGATTIKIGMPTHMIPSLIFHYNLKYFNSDLEHYEGVNLKRFVMQSVESGSGAEGSNGQVLLSNIVTFRVHLPENGAYILDIFANSTTPTQYITGEPMKFKSVCKFKIIARNLKTVMIPLPDCASGEYGPMKATRLFGIIPLTHESGLISVQNEKRFLEIQFRMTRPLLDFMASLHKNGYDERQLSKSIKIFIDGDIVFVTVKFFEDGQYGLDIYTRDHMISNSSSNNASPLSAPSINGRKATAAQSSAVDMNLSNEPKKQLLTHCCKYLINVRTLSTSNINNNNNRL